MKRSHLALVFLAAAALAVFVTATRMHRDSGDTESRATISVARALGDGDAQGFARAYAPRPFVFPADHGPHPAFKQEWWYYTGNLETANHRHFGFQLTFFRIALAPHAPLRDSAWATNQVYMAHFTVSDVTSGRFHQFQRFGRAALRLAGATAIPFHVWLDDWKVTATGAPDFTQRLQANQDDVAIDITLRMVKPLVLQGDHGLSQKSSQPGNASYYYSLPRLATQGQVRIGRETFFVTGTSWMDREWSTSALSPQQSGWDWFALQLSDGDELMLYRIRTRHNDIDPHSGGVLVRKDGQVLPLRLNDITLRTVAYWRSSHTGVEYPAAWTLQVPREAIDIEIRPYLADQELRGAIRYWEGAVRIQGRARDAPLQGVGYVELTGYGDERRGQ